MEAALEPPHTARSHRRSSCPAVWIDWQLTGRSAALCRHHAALTSEDTPHARCAAARSVIPHSPDAKVLTLDQGHVTIRRNPFCTPYTMLPGCTPKWYKASRCARYGVVYGGVVPLRALLREQLELARSRQLRRDRRLAHSRRATKEDQLPGSRTALRGRDGHVRPTQRLEKTADKGRIYRLSTVEAPTHILAFLSTVLQN